MKKTVKRILAIMLVVVMTIGVTPLSGFVGLDLPEFGGFKNFADSVSKFFDGFATKAEATTYSGTCGENLKWYLDTSTGLLSITGTGKMTDYSNKEDTPWYQYKNNIKDVMIENGVESIGDYAFDDYGLNSFVIPDSVTRVGSWAIGLYNWNSAVLLPDRVTNLGDGAICYVDGNGNVCGVQIYYTGTSEQYYNLVKDQKYNNMMSARVYYLQKNEAWYRVESYKANTSGIHILDSRTFHSGTAYSEILHTPDTITGYSVDKDLSNLTSLITADSMAVVKVYYSKIYTVSFVDSDTTVELASIHYKYGDTSLGMSLNPSKKGYTFSHWSYNGKKISFPITVTQNMTLVAVWEPKEYTVTLNSNGGVWSDGSSSIVVPCFYGVKIAFPDENPKLEGYNFAYWEDVEGNAVLPGDEMPSSNLNLSAKYMPKEAATYFIECYIMDNDNKYSMSNRFADYGVVGQIITVVPETIKGLAFNPTLSIIEGIITEDGKATLKVYYDRDDIESKTYTITWRNGENEIIDSYLYGEEIILPVIENEEEYIFLGWDKTVPQTMPAENLEFNAIKIKEDDLLDNSKIRAFSSKPELRLGENDEIDMQFEVETTLNGLDKCVPNITFSFTSSDTNVFTVDNIINKGNSTSIRINKKNSGSAILSVTAYYNGKYIAGGEYLIISDGNKVYYANTVPQTNGFNFVSNGMVVDSFKYEKEALTSSSSQQTYTISFNVYNQTNCIGSAEIYNKDGKLLYSKSISAFTGNIPTGIWDTFKNLYEYFSQDILRDSTYKDSINSEETEICFANVPADAYISISNDVNSSMPCALYNLSSLFVRITAEALSAYFPKPPSDEVINNATEILAKKVLPEMLKSPVASKTLLKILEKFCDALSHGSESKEMDAVVDDYILFVDFLNIDVGEILIDAAIDAGIGVVEGLVYASLGSAGVIIKTAFKLFSLSKIASHIETLDKFAGSGKTVIYVPSSNDQKLYSNGYSVSSQQSFGSNVSFHQYGITTGEDWLDAKQTFSNMKYIDVIGMDLYKDGVKVQPSGTVEVAIPIPSSFDSSEVERIKVFRKESDGSYTELKCDYRDLANGYIYIKTDHFSVYCIVSDAVTELTDLSFELTEISIPVDGYYYNEPIFNPEDAYKIDLVWKSSDESIAKVTDSGFVVGVSYGTATITATTSNNICSSYIVTVEPVKYNSVWIVDGVETVQLYEEGSEIIKPDDPVKEGYKFLGWTPSIPDTMPAQDLTFTATWEVNCYDAVFNANGGSWNDGATEITVSTEYGAKIIAPEIPAKQGYIFSKWSPEIGIMDSIDGKTFTAEWIPATDTRYTVETYTMNTAGEYEKTVQTLGGTTGETVSTNPEIKTGFALNSEKSILSGTVAADNSLVLKVFIDRNTYTFATVVDNISSETKYYYGSIISDPVPPTKEGYKFIGWDKEIPSTMPAGNVTVTALFEKIPEAVVVEIPAPSTTTINYGDSIWLHAKIKSELPVNAKIIWTPSNNNFEIVEVSADGLSCKITPKSSGTTTFTVSVVDADEKVLATDTQDMTAKAGLWQKIVAFFKKLFGATKTYPELYKSLF